jgi:hypothetical protein
MTEMSGCVEAEHGRYNDMMRTEPEAAELADAYSQRHKVLGQRSWRGERFSRGWIMAPEGEDLDGWTGVVCLIVLDDGRIFLDNLSSSHSSMIDRYSSPFPPDGPVPPLDEAEGAARAASYADEHLGHLGAQTWVGERFSQGWLFGPGRQDDHPRSIYEARFDLPAVITLDDGRVFEDSASMPAMFVIERYEAMLAREAAQEI